MNVVLQFVSDDLQRCYHAASMLTPIFFLGVSVHACVLSVCVCVCTHVRMHLDLWE